MPAGKQKHPCFATFCGLPAVLFLLLTLMSAGWVFAAGSPFEIEIGDLEGGEAASKEVKKPQAQPSVKIRGRRADSVPNVTADDRQEEDYVKYTIRSGDNIYTILTKRFGLSSKKAERLIPEIKRINGIVDTSGLQIGQTLLLPLARKKVVVPRETSPAPTPTPIPIPIPEPAPPAVVETPLALTPSVDEGLLRRAKEFWARLFPERKPLEPAAGIEEPGSAHYPFLAGVNGKEIRIVPPGIPPVFGKLSGAGVEKWETVVANPANEKGFVKDLLQAAGFATTDGGTPLEFGSVPKLSLKADFTAAKRIPGAELRKTILVLLEKNGCQTIPESLASYLDAKGFRLVEWCDSTLPPEGFPSLQVITVPPGKPAQLVDAVLDAFSLKVSKDYPIEIVVGRTGEAPLSVTVDRYFEEDGKRFFLDFGNKAPNRSTLFRLLELAGYREITVGDTDDFRAVAAKISAAVKIPVEYRTHLLTSIPAGRYTIEMAGILFPRPGNNGEKVLLTDIPLDQPFLDLLKAVPWGTQ